MTKYIPPYSAKEELFNSITHGIGLILSIPALILLVVFSIEHKSALFIVSCSIYGCSLVTLYLASTLYHLAKKEEIKKKLNVFDHSAIYLLIAGTYTPFLLVVLQGAWGWSLFGIIWGIAIIGVLFKLISKSRLKIVSATAYLLMGWVVIIILKPLLDKFSAAGLWWLFGGGLSYSVGAVFYVLKKIPQNHGIFHLFVLGGSIAHWIAVFYYIL